MHNTFTDHFTACWHAEEADVVEVNTFWTKVSGLDRDVAAKLTTPMTKCINGYSVRTEVQSSQRFSWLSRVRLLPFAACSDFSLIGQLNVYMMCVLHASSGLPIRKWMDISSALIWSNGSLLQGFNLLTKQSITKHLHSHTRCVWVQNLK